MDFDSSGEVGAPPWGFGSCTDRSWSNFEQLILERALGLPSTREERTVRQAVASPSIPHAAAPNSADPSLRSPRHTPLGEYSGALPRSPNTKLVDLRHTT